MNPQSRNPGQFLILVNVTFPLGAPVYTYSAFANGSKADDIKVAPGDQIGWFVRVQQGAGWSSPGYTLTFTDSSILGTASIAVPHGGLSGFHAVVALSTKKAKYSVAVAGVLPIGDPTIQVDPNGAFIIGSAGFAQHSVRWTPALNKMEYQKSGGPWSNFASPVAIAPDDKVQFFAVLTSAPPNFEIIFPSDHNNNAFASPFDLIAFQFFATTLGLSQSTDNLPVAHTSGTFQFEAALMDGSAYSGFFAFQLA
jgi:hypothetical protein